MVSRPSSAPRQPDRAATEAALEEAALRSLERDGVLAGLNLREVAAEAGVNRGLVYHYFGSRRELLRAALRADARRRFAEVAESAGLPLRERFARFLRTILRHRRAVNLVTLLVQDGDRSMRTMPLREGTLAVLRRDVEDGYLDDLDLGAVHVAMVSLAYGYVLYREHFAAELTLTVGQLDERFASICDRMLSGLEPR
ncbi:MAG: TetR/AcrR family transcriptional regulator [Acidimicrobiales bacterium]